MGGSRSAGAIRPLVPLVRWMALTLLIAPGAVLGQVPPGDREPDPAAAPGGDRYWHVLTYAVSADRLDVLGEYLRAVAVPVGEALERRGELVERRWLVRDFGKEFSLVVMSRWADPRATWTERTPADELEIAFEDEARREEARRLGERLFEGLSATSVVYREVDAASSAAGGGAADPER